MQPNPELTSLVERVIEQIKKDLANGDETAIEELLALTPQTLLEQFLPEQPDA